MHRKWASHGVSHPQLQISTTMQSFNITSYMPPIYQPRGLQSARPVRILFVVCLMGAAFSACISGEAEEVNDPSQADGERESFKAKFGSRWVRPPSRPRQRYCVLKVPWSKSVEEWMWTCRAAALSVAFWCRARHGHSKPEHSRSRPL